MRVSDRALFCLATLSFSFTTIANPIANAPTRLPNSDDDLTPSTIKPSSSKPYMTIYTDADVTWCRPYPNTAIHPKAGRNYYRGTPINLTCWTHNDIPGTEAGESEPWDIWVRTEAHGCYINENDLKSANIVFEDVLNFCKTYGPIGPLAGNRPEMPGEALSPLSPTAPLVPATPLASNGSQAPASPLPPAIPITPTVAIPIAPVSPIKPTPAVALPSANASKPLDSPKSANATKIGSRGLMARNHRLSNQLF